MCETCGCGDPEIVPLEVQERILSDNDAQAAHNRSHFEELGILAINLMGSPGAGKTAVLEATARAAGDGLRLGAVSGDLATARDADRLNAAGIVSTTITTGSACHLDARLVHHALHDFPSTDRDVFFIENVGNLVCPAIYDLGQAANVVTLSVTEGEDKPLKYPVMFQKADLVLLTKIDLVPHLDFDVTAVRESLTRVMPEAHVIEVSAKTGQGIDAWLAWLERRRPAFQGTRGHARHHHHHHMNTGSLFASLTVAAITIGSLHSLAPDHWVPIAAVARARNWSKARTARVAFLCGVGHVTVSVLLGLLALLFGAQLFQSFGERMVSVAGLLLIGFGVAYAVWGLRGAFAHRIHGHHHHHYDHVHDPSKASTWSLFLIYCADPCVAVIPILFAAAPLSAVETLRNAARRIQDINIHTTNPITI